MSENVKIVRTVPKTVPKMYVISQNMDWTEPKLYVPRINGRPTAKKRWYVWFNYRNPKTGKFDNKSKIVVYHKINQLYKTTKERREYGQSLIRAYTRLLEEGYNPFEKDKVINSNVLLKQEQYNLKEAIEFAFNRKTKTISEKTLPDWKYRTNLFLQYAEKRGFDDLDINEVGTFYISSFLDSIATEQSGKSVNNFRACLSSLWSELNDAAIAENNPVKLLKKRKERSTKNKPFSPEQIQIIKKHIEKEDPLLLDFIRFVSFAFLRPIEVVRLTVGDIDMIHHRLTVKTKTEEMSTVRIIPQLQEILKKIKLQNYSQSDFLFTPNGKPGIWDAKESSRTQYFSDRFGKIKKELGFGEEYGIYSFRHSFALDLYNSFIKKGMTKLEAEINMLPITRHKSLSGLRNYLRGIGALLPDDYGDNFSIDL